MNLFSIARRVFGLGPNITAAPLAMSGLGSSPITVQVAAPTPPSPRPAPQVAAGPTPYQLSRRHEEMQQLRFGYVRKMGAAKSTSEKEAVRLAYLEFCEGQQAPAPTPVAAKADGSTPTGDDDSAADDTLTALYKELSDLLATCLNSSATMKTPTPPRRRQSGCSPPAGSWRQSACFPSAPKHWRPAQRVLRA